MGGDAIRWFAPDEDLSGELVLSGELRGAIDTLAAELRAVDRFVRAGVDPPTRVLFSGPSGTGKTLAARWLAHRLKKQLAVIDVAAVVGSHLGETSKALSSAFTDASTRKAVLFLDEIDAVCAKRGTLESTGGAELERATTTLFQQLDWLAPAHVVIAATNFPDELDVALRRRLTTHVAFSVPDRDARRAMLERWLSRSPLPPEVLDALADGSEGLSGAELRSRAMAAARRAVMALPDDEPKKRVERAADSVARGQEVLRLLESMGGQPS